MRCAWTAPCPSAVSRSTAWASSGSVPIAAASAVLSRGGRYTLDNIVPACRSCNASKCNAEVTGWMRRKRLDERAFLLRHIEVSSALVRRFGVADDLGS